MAFDRLSSELTEALLLKHIEHPGKGVPLPDDLFPDPRDPALATQMVENVKAEGVSSKKQFIAMFVYNLFGELHSADLLAQQFAPKADYVEIGKPSELAAVPYVSVQGREVVGVDPNASYVFDSKGRFRDVSPDGKPMISTMRSGKVSLGGRFDRDKFQADNLDRADYAGNVRFFQSALNGQPVKPKALDGVGADAEATKITDDVAALAILKACSDMVFGNIDGSAVAAGDYVKVSPLDTGERTPESRWFGYTRKFRFTLIAPLGIDSLAKSDQDIIKRALRDTEKSLGASAKIATDHIEVSYTRSVDLKVGMRSGRWDSETMGSLD